MIGDRDTADRVVDDLVPDEDLHRIGPHIAIDIEEHHRFIVEEVLVGLGHGNEERFIDRRDAIGRRAHPR